MEAAQAPTPCSQQTFSFQALENRKVEVDFSGGYLSSDGGSVLLREIDNKRRFTASLAGCFSNHRCEPLVEHELAHLLAQRIHAIALGYEDINDHDKLRLDPVLALSYNKADLLGEGRSEEDRGKALAGKSTLNRLELGSNGLGKTKKIRPHPGRLRDFLIDEGVRRIPRRSRVITLDFDATDDPVHGYYGHYFNRRLLHRCPHRPVEQASLLEVDVGVGVEPAGLPVGADLADKILVEDLLRRLPRCPARGYFGSPGRVPNPHGAPAKMISDRRIRYFAYGSNLHPVRLRERVPSARLAGTCALAGWRLRFHKVGSRDGSGKADIVPAPGHAIHGAVFELDAAGLAALDIAEGAGAGYDRRGIDLGEHGSAFTYLAHADHVRPDILPFTWYRDLVLHGARFHGFPEAYVDMIETVGTREDPDDRREKCHRELLARMGM